MKGSNVVKCSSNSSRKLGCRESRELYGKQRIVWCMIAYILQEAVTVSNRLGNYKSVLLYALEKIIVICTGVPDPSGGIR